MAAVVFASTAVGGYGTECTLREGGGIHYTIHLAVGEGKGVARAHKTKHAGGGGGWQLYTQTFLLGFTAF